MSVRSDNNCILHHQPGQLQQQAVQLDLSLPFLRPLLLHLGGQNPTHRPQRWCASSQQTMPYLDRLYKFTVQVLAASRDIVHGRGRTLRTWLVWDGRRVSHHPTADIWTVLPSIYNVMLFLLIRSCLILCDLLGIIPGPCYPSCGAIAPSSLRSCSWPGQAITEKVNQRHLVIQLL